MISLRSRPLVVVLIACALGACDAGEPEADGPPPNPLLRPSSFDATAPPTYEVVLETTEGDVRVRVQRDWAPRGADRFYNLVRSGFYDGVTFHRVVEGLAAQFGIHPDPYVNQAWKDEFIQDEEPARSNDRGTVAFAKAGRHSRTVQVFVNLEDNPSLDEQDFAPFGEVVEGMETIDALHSGYGDGPPRGEGVYQARALAMGEEYLADFPELDRIERAYVVGEGEAGGAAS
jgi:peptidyl-prolyl cis-trans isomerase A (cyclophilin A)